MWRITRLATILLLFSMSFCRPSVWVSQSAQTALLAKQQAGFVSLADCQQAFATKRAADLNAAKVQLAVTVALSCLVAALLAVAVARSDSELIVKTIGSPAAKGIAAGLLTLGGAIVVQKYFYQLDVNLAEATYRVSLYKCK